MSEFWARKIRTFFARIDVNNDGFISKKDAELMADRLAESEILNPEKREELKRYLVEFWRKCLKSEGSDDDGLLTASILVASIGQQRDDPEFKETYSTMVRAFFGLLDVNRDGYLSADELAKPLSCIGIPDTRFVNDSFEYMDVNKDGKLSLTEYVTALVKYLTTEDDHLLWGPLVS